MKQLILTSYELLGDVLAYTKDRQGAEAVFRQGMAADPNRMTGRFELGVCW